MKGGRQDWRGTNLLTQGGGCRMVAKCLVCFLEKTTSSHICSALWLVEKPLKSVPWANSLRVFTTWLIGSFLWVLCAGLSPPGWLLNETESRAYTTQIEAHSWYLHDQSFTSTHHTVYWSIESEWEKDRLDSSSYVRTRFTQKSVPVLFLAGDLHWTSDSDGGLKASCD